MKNIGKISTCRATIVLITALAFFFTFLFVPLNQNAVLAKSSKIHLKLDGKKNIIGTVLLNANNDRKATISGKISGASKVTIAQVTGGDSVFHVKATDGKFAEEITLPQGQNKVMLLVQASKYYKSHSLKTIHNVQIKSANYDAETAAAASSKLAAKSKSLATGNWTVGKDIQPGWYTATSTGGSGNFQTEDGEINVILSTQVDNDMGQIDSYRIHIKTGQTVQISGLQGVHFQAISKHPKISGGTISAGFYRIGKDIKPGRYKISAVQGSGNVQTNDGEVNEILATNPDSSMGQVGNTTVDLSKGEILMTDLEQVSLTQQ
ncbi:hypothetical protein [Oenococcus sicerae]|uniref:Uncharacterized protein n=1 Tax=Oenococcus sicerae TaxID=2203724 RepID=A0AAJ1RE45_9LACO|nr:hypothetical protein [Oenococcus sicerae]MDN6901077.1 hypothetical protein [Oenococcus sicerae]